MIPDEAKKDYPPFKMIWMERIKQNVQWGEQDHSDFKWLAILGEEFGEVCNSVVEAYALNNTEERRRGAFNNLEYELVQTAAVCVAWIEAIRRRNNEAILQDMDYINGLHNTLKYLNNE